MPKIHRLDAYEIFLLVVFTIMIGIGIVAVYAGVIGKLC